MVKNIKKLVKISMFFQPAGKKMFFGRFNHAYPKGYNNGETKDCALSRLKNLYNNLYKGVSEPFPRLTIALVSPFNMTYTGYAETILRIIFFVNCVPLMLTSALCISTLHAQVNTYN